MVLHSPADGSAPDTAVFTCTPVACVLCASPVRFDPSALRECPLRERNTVKFPLRHLKTVGSALASKIRQHGASLCTHAGI